MSEMVALALALSIFSTTRARTFPMIFLQGNSLGMRLLRILFVLEVLGPVAQMLDSAIHRINLKY